MSQTKKEKKEKVEIIGSKIPGERKRIQKFVSNFQGKERKSPEQWFPMARRLKGEKKGAKWV